MRTQTPAQTRRVKSDMRIESHFLIIHKYSSLSVHECHVNEHRQGGERKGGRRGGGGRRLRERERETPLEVGRD